MARLNGVTGDFWQDDDIGRKWIKLKIRRYVALSNPIHDSQSPWRRPQLFSAACQSRTLSFPKCTEHTSPNIRNSLHYFLIVLISGMV
jgi:hypothetical protein